jgi:hypothetical protein
MIDSVKGKRRDLEKKLKDVQDHQGDNGEDLKKEAFSAWDDAQSAVAGMKDAFRNR